MLISKHTESALPQLQHSACYLHQKWMILLHMVQEDIVHNTKIGNVSTNA